jgi:hypothetical protein
MFVFRIPKFDPVFGHLNLNVSPFFSLSSSNVFSEQLDGLVPSGESESVISLVEVINFTASVKKELREYFLDFVDNKYKEVENEIKNQQQLYEQTLVQEKKPPPSPSSSPLVVALGISFPIIVFFCWRWLRKHPNIKLFLIFVPFLLSILFPSFFLDEVLYPIIFYIKSKYTYFITETEVGRTVNLHLQSIGQSSFIQTKFLPLFNIFVKPIVLQIKSSFVFVFKPLIEKNRKRWKKHDLKIKKSDETIRKSKSESSISEYNQVFD